MTEATLGDECLRTETGESYVGHLDHSVSGTKCQEWSESVPRDHSYDDITYFADYEKNEEAIIHDVVNYCRNPSILSFHDVHPWCFTVDPGIPDKFAKEYCNIPRCKSKYVIGCFLSRVEVQKAMQNVIVS